jgi:hypothetical protein
MAKKKAVKKKVVKKKVAKKKAAKKNFWPDKVITPIAERLNKITDKENQLKETKDVIIKSLSEVGAVTAEAQYSGGGDSGQVDTVTAFSKDGGEVDITDEMVTVEMFSSSFVDTNWVETLKPKTISLKEAIEDFATTWVYMNHGGYENNEGGQGTCVFIVDRNEVELLHEDNEVITHHSGHTL